MRVSHSEEYDFFDKNGYVVLKNVIPKTQLDSFKSTLDKLLDSIIDRAGISHEFANSVGKISCDEKIIRLKDRNTEYVSLAQRIISRTPEFYDINSNPDVVSFMRSLYNLEENSPVYIINNGVVFTCPKDYENISTSNFETDWHNDIFYTIPESNFWQIWIPLLNEASTDIGTLVVCPGSHKDGIGKQMININVNYNNRYTVEESSLARYKPKAIELNLGDVLIFDSRLVHRSGKNISNNIRCTMLGAYHDAATKNFLPVAFEYKYYNKTPEGYFYEIFGDEIAKNIMLEDLAETNLSFKTGV